MKRIFLGIFSVLIAFGALAQIPEKMNYQAVVRDNDDKLVRNQQIGLQISILQGTDETSTTQVYSEIQTPTTNTNGLISIEFGGATNWENIDWSAGNYFIKTEVDPSGGTDYSISGASKLLSVPYAFYAQSSGNTGGSAFSSIVFTNEASMITTTSAQAGGNVVGGTSAIIERGVCWSTEQNPTLSDNKTSDGDGFGYYSSDLNNLTPGATIYIRAYATSSTGTSYGNQAVLTTPLNVLFPTVSTTSVSNITANSAVSGGIISSSGGGEITAQGVCWSANQNPTISDPKTEDGATNGQFQSQIAGLVPGTYYVRAYATNSAGTGYGNLETFSIEKTLPVITTKDITDISAMGAVSGGIISSEGGGAITERGICWSESPNPTIENEKAKSPANSSSFSAAIAKASANTTYYIRAYATNQIGTAYGDEKSFTTAEAQYHTSFETGLTPTGWSGSWTVTAETAFDGSYSFKSLYDQSCNEELSITLESDGQISFYYSFTGSGAISMTFYINDILISVYPNDDSGWHQAFASIPSGTHTLKWHYEDKPSKNSFGTMYHYKGKCYIDQITITK